MSSQNPLTQPMVPLQAQQNGPAPVRAPNTPVGWALGSCTPGPVGQRIPSHLPPKIPTTLPNNSQGLQHTSNPPSMVPGFTAGPRGPSGGPSAATGEGAALTPQVTGPLFLLLQQLYESFPFTFHDVCGGLQVKFDDNNPFSEGFQERERRERLREQQERQRVQLMQEVPAHQRGAAVCCLLLRPAGKHHFLFTSSLFVGGTSPGPAAETRTEAAGPPGDICWPRSWSCVWVPGHTNTGSCRAGQSKSQRRWSFSDALL